MDITNEEAVEIRPSLSTWVLIFLMGLWGAGFGSMPYWADSPHHPGAEDTIFAGVVVLVGSVIVAGAVAAGIWMGQAVVRADEDGLRWRGWGQWRETPWDAILDFFQEPSRPGGIHVIETGVKPLKLGPCWKVTEEFKNTVARLAINSSCHTWGLKGARLDERWPVTFDYDSAPARELRQMSWIMIAALVALIAQRVYQLAGSGVTGPDFKWRLAISIISFFPIALISLLYAVLMRPAWKARECKAHHITVSPQCITFKDERRFISASWEEVSSVHRTPSIERNWVVRTTRGDFEFTGMLRDFRALYVLLERFAPRAIDAGLHAGGDADSLVAAPPLAADGTMVFTYRTRTARALLGFLFWFALMLMVAPVLPHWHTRTSADQYVPTALGTLLLVASSWSVWRYLVARVVLDHAGIRYDGPFGCRFLAWSEITEVRTRSSDASTSVLYRIHGTSGKVSFPQLLAHEALFRREVATRAFRTAIDYDSVSHPL